MILRSGILALTAVACMASGASAAAQTGDRGNGWPCSDPPKSIPDASWLWDDAHHDLNWRQDSSVAELVGAVSRRAMPEAEATIRISKFAAERADRLQAMERLASGLIATIGAEQRTVLNRIGQFNTRQAKIAKRIQAGYAKLDELPVDGVTRAAASSPLQDQIDWDTRIFETRQRVLPVMCNIPGVLDERLGTLLAAARNAAGIQASAAGYLIYVSNEYAGEISIIDPARQAEVGRIAVGKRPRGLVVGPDHKLLYVAVSGSPIAGPGVNEATLPPPEKAADGIAVIDIASRKVLRTLRGVSDPEQLALSPDGKHLYVSSEDTGELLVLNMQGTVLHKLAVGGQPEGVTVSADGSTVLATSEEDNKVAVIDVSGTPKILAFLPVGERPRNSTFLPSGRALIPGEFDSSLTIIDHQNLQVLRTIRLGERDLPMNVQLDSSGIAYVTTGRSGKLIKVDTDDASSAAPIIASATVGRRPWGLALSPDGTTAFTANGPGNDVTIVDLQNMRVVGKVQISGSPWGLVVVPTDF